MLYSAKMKAVAFLWLLIISFILWLALTSGLSLPELICGGVISLLIAFLGVQVYSQIGLPTLTPKKCLFILVYIVVLFREIIKANFDVAYRVVHPKMPIKPGIVIIRTGLKSDIAKTILANSITLTPGTFTLDILGDRLLIHWINVRTENLDEATEIIGERFEKYLRVILE